MASSKRYDILSLFASEAEIEAFMDEHLPEGWSWEIEPQRWGGGISLVSQGRKTFYNPEDYIVQEFGTPRTRIHGWHYDAMMSALSKLRIAMRVNLGLHRTIIYVTGEANSLAVAA